MFELLQKKRVKRQLIKQLYAELWTSEIDSAHQAKGVADVQVVLDERTAKVVELTKQLEELQASHTKADRDKAKDVSEELKGAEKAQALAHQTITTMQKNIDSKAAHQTYLKGRIEFIKKHM